MPDFWIFAYGSLMWRPGFAYEAALPAQCKGAHRALCVYSVHYRGTPKRPGLVLGLDLGGSCQGVAYLIPRRAAPETLGYVRRRELVTRAYREFSLPVHLLDGSERQVRAVCYLANRSHSQYAGALPLANQAAIVRRSYGHSGSNIDYLVNTVAHLRGFGVCDPRLERLMVLLGLQRRMRELCRAQSMLSS